LEKSHHDDSRERLATIAIIPQSKTGTRDSPLYQKCIGYQEPLINYSITLKYPGMFSDSARKKLSVTVLEHPTVLYWLSQLHCDQKLTRLHGSFDNCYENACNKCIQFGLSVRDNIFYQTLTPFHDWLLSIPLKKEGPIDFSYAFYRNLLAFNLFRAGFEDKAILDTIQFRIKQVYQFVIQNRYELYVSPDHYPAMPKNFQKHRLVDPALFEDGMSIFPNIHDLMVFHAYYVKTTSNKEKSMIDRIIQYCVSPQYDSQIENGYGVMFVPPRVFYRIGWSVHLMKYNKLLFCSFYQPFQAFQNSSSGKNLHQQYDTFKNSDGDYFLPIESLQEKTGYYVSGSHMGMGVNRKKKNWREIESAYWMLVI